MKETNIISKGLKKIKYLFNKEEKMKIQETIDYFDKYYYEFFTKDDKPVNGRETNSNILSFTNASIKLLDDNNDIQGDVDSEDYDKNDTDTDSEIFYDALDNFDFLTNYNSIERNEIKKLHEKPLIPERLWKHDSTEMEIAIDAWEYFKDKNDTDTDDGYYTNSNSVSENDIDTDEEIFYDAESNLEADDDYKLIINHNSILKPSNNTKHAKTKDINNTKNNLIVMQKVKKCIWNIQQNNQNDNKINKKIILENEENYVLENLIKQYKNIIIIFDKNTKNFKEAFVIDNQGNKKNIAIDKIETVKSLEKIFKKVTKVLNQSLNDFDTKKINNLAKQKTHSNSNNNKSKNNHWRKYVTRI